MSTSSVFELEASLQCELDGHSISIEANPGVIVVSIEALQVASAIIKVVRNFGTLRSTLSRVNGILLATSHRLELHVDDVMIASMGYGTGSGLLRLAGMRHVRVWPSRLLRGGVRIEKPEQ